MSEKFVWVGMDNGGYVDRLVVLEEEPINKEGMTWRKVTVSKESVEEASDLEAAIKLAERCKKEYTGESVVERCRNNDDPTYHSPFPPCSFQESVELTNALKDKIKEVTGEPPLETLEEQELYKLKLRIENKDPTVTEEDMIEYVTKTVRKNMVDAMQPPTKESVRDANKRWVALIEEAVQNRFELLEHFNLMDRIEDQTITMALTFRYDPELKVGRFVSMQEQFHYTHPEPIKFLRGRYTVSESFWNEKEKNDEK
jgi:hypothetical protein